MNRPATRTRYAIYGYYAAAVMACLGVFALYTRPDFLVTLANQVWACF
jgi:transposase InsO family protein